MLPFEANIWQAQNIWHDLLVGADGSSAVPPDNTVMFHALGRALAISVEAFLQEPAVTRGSTRGQPVLLN